MNYILQDKDLYATLADAERKLFSSERFKFEKSQMWRSNTIPNNSGVYALFEERDKLLYVGETGNLRLRMNDINRTVNHSFRKQLGLSRFGGIKSRKKFSEEIELQLDLFYMNNLHVSFIEVNFGRLEIETFIITNNQTQLLNSEKKRKVELKIISADN